MKYFILMIASFLVANPIFADEAVFKIADKTTSIVDVPQENKAEFFEIEEKKYRLIEQKAQAAYLNYFWQEQAKKNGGSPASAQQTYMKDKIKVSEREVKDTLEKFKDNAQLKALTPEQQQQEVRKFLEGKAHQDVLNKIIADGIKSKTFQIVYPRPLEPTYDPKVTKSDIVRYGPKSSDTKPIKCKDEECPITVVEYSEFQCPFCGKAQPATDRVLTEYKGKIRWIVRDFPLSFHDRARPAAVAAHCAGDQNKYWDMYEVLFKNQQALTDADFEKYAKSIKGLNIEKWRGCLKSPSAKEQIVESNFRSGSAMGVNGTPGYFINGRKLSGALPFEEFKRVIDEELSRK